MGLDPIALGVMAVDGQEVADGAKIRPQITSGAPRAASAAMACVVRLAAGLEKITASMSSSGA